MIIGFAVLTVVAYVVLLGALMLGRRDETPVTDAGERAATMDG
ncbi:hypothetical protein GCM10023350_44630 [Nocardioides endophyticus]|uniref:CcmD family protein n=1 Tax=Nocardioides endophyticus TaxID=1353775 RepID=A0ABP8ZE41_9ACTN